MRQQNCRVILASGSPRRKELLSQAEIQFEVWKSEKEEVTDKRDPAGIVCDLSSQKAEEAAEKILLQKPSNGLVQDLQGSSLLIIGADTIVASDSTENACIFGKPVDREEAFSMIKGIQGNSHFVYTGVTVLVYSLRDGSFQREEKMSFSEETRVNVLPMEDSEIWEYVDTGEPVDKAGAYGIQGRFAPYIKGIEGDYYNVVGLPLSALYQKIKKYF